jgi:hypothetical protein
MPWSTTTALDWRRVAIGMTQPALSTYARRRQDPGLPLIERSRGWRRSKAAGGLYCAKADKVLTHMNRICEARRQIRPARVAPCYGRSSENGQFGSAWPRPHISADLPVNRCCPLSFGLPANALAPSTAPARRRDGAHVPHRCSSCIRLRRSRKLIGGASGPW